MSGRIKRAADPDEAAAELRELVRQAHEAAQQLKTASKAARVQCDEYLGTEVKKALDLYTNNLQTEVYSWTREAVADVQRVMDTACERAKSHITQDAELTEVVRVCVRTTLDYLAEEKYAFMQSDQH